jgi:ribosomal protein L18E
MHYRQLLLARIEVARKELDEADDELVRLLHELRSAPRSEKTTISRVVAEALDKLKVARAHLSDLERDLASGEQ